MAYPASETRVIQLRGQVVQYTLVRRKRRSIGLKVDATGLLTISAPAREPYHHLDQVIVEREAWIVEKIAQMQARQLPARKWKSGECLPFLGSELELYLYRTYTRTDPIRSTGRILVGVPDLHDGEGIKSRVAAWYRRLAQQHFAERIASLAPRLGVAPPPFKLSEAKTAWGVCTPEGQLRLSWRLIKAPQEQIDYVVAHELAHLRHMDHSRAFWQTVGAIYPDYQRERKALEQDGHRYHTF
jgi:predicted metal-dependent hydrolase